MSSQIRHSASAHPPPPPSLFKYSVWANITYIFVVSVCIYPGLHQSSSKVKSQGQASGRSLNRGTSIMAPASAQVPLTPAQEKEDDRSQEQAAKAEIKSTGNKIIKTVYPLRIY